MTLQKMLDEAPSPVIKEMRAREQVLATVQRTVLEPWRHGWLKRDATAFSAVTSSEGSLAWASSPRELHRENDGIREFSWKLQKATAADEADRYLAAFASVDDFQFAIPTMTVTPASVTLTLNYDLRGQTIAHARRQDRGTLEVTLAQKDGVWKIASLQPGAFESLETAPKRAPRFADATAATGLDSFPQEERKEALRRGGYAIAVSDYDGDSFADVLLGSYGPMRLYRNTEKGFEDVTAAAGIRQETLVKAAAFADLDNDGHKDLVLIRFNDKGEHRATSEKVMDGFSGEGDFVAYRNLGNGKFEWKGDVTMRHRHYDRSMPLAIADFDSNGTLDIYVGFPGSRDFTNDLPRSPSTGLAKQGLWLNDGKWKFEEAPADSALGSSGKVFPHAALATDLNQDGKPELVVVDDSGQLNPVYRNDGAGRFTDVTNEWKLSALGWGMGATAGDFDGDGLSDLLMTDLSLSPVNRMRDIGTQIHKRGTQKPGDAHAGRMEKSMHLFRNLGGGQFEEVSQKAGLTWAGEAPSGAEWVDYNADGNLDLFVTNGLWSGGAEDAGAFFAQVIAARGERSAAESDPAMSRPGDGKEPNPFLTILREFKGQLSNPAAASSSKATLSFGGYQHKRLFRNNGDGTFTDVAFLEGADRVEDGYMVAVADFDHDGAQDLMLRNADPAPGVSFPAVVLLRNNRAANSLSVSLKGIESNRDGVGALVTATVAGKKFVREVRAVGGAVQSEEVAFFGLGEKKDVEKLEVRWPSGKVETFGKVKAGRVLLTEGKGLVVQASLEKVKATSPN